jgi:hypothetical protein
MEGQCAPRVHRSTGKARDEVLRIEYPSRDTLLAMLESPEDQAMTLHRIATLEDARLIVTLKTNR